ncbi:MAG: helix-turn-helix domain-containing protein [gamma proteobacterium symbiont of Bathyaustriella thionipta]|nr:helix-turn-helix domain-containing protein [gamma proteobacterium symbiont of Bathyaustriella thionipta]MCU7949272.1 helix-turn-helix domain-containing protein [gamma proteobacterium symbiont of Bathyaustriella thionipta]MCU7954412.1 helix-turn-helix domain-containing protein [gamma proteobacterium symbiont of Bathyaustriella thionipta]MCU7955867.1 helix-turn-helix domain-containing protein [gamma proteobacterium symbiont of Bathyaustriella thionipta]MCU7967545.1 helix-turn-helix domain-cont
MPINNLYSMSDLAIAKEIGQRIEQLRLEANISQETIAEELGITTKTYRNLKNGKTKFELLIGVLRVLNSLELVERFIPESTFSPIELMKLKGKQRQRASRQTTLDSESLKANTEQSPW